jgi:hypothetical protein
MNPVTNHLADQQAWIDSLPPVELSDNFMGEDIPESERKPSGDKTKEKAKSQASLLTEFTKARCELFHDKNREGFAFEHGTNTTMRLDSRTFKDWLQSGFYVLLKVSASDKSLREAVATLSGIARFSGNRYEVNLRVGKAADVYIIDLCDSVNPAFVAVNADGWKLLRFQSLKFIRTETMQALPTPQKGGDINLLWNFVNVPEEARLLVLAFMIECFRRDTPYPILELMGEQGSGKSQTQKMLRRLIDPNSCDLRSSPKTAEDIFIAAGVNHLLSYENVSHLSGEMQDKFCTVATGGGFATRRLYTNNEESVIDVQRPAIINGIIPNATQQDLVDRCISIELPVLAERRESTLIASEFEQARGAIFGGLIDIFAKALKLLPSIDLPAKDAPRLIEFAKLGMGIAKALGHEPQKFLDEFNAYRQESISRTLDASPIATAAHEWLQSIGETTQELPLKSLMQKIEQFKPAYCDSWPRSVKGFGDALRRAAPALRQLGFELKSMGKVGSTIRYSARKLSKTSRECRGSRDDDQIYPSSHDIHDIHDMKTKLFPAESESVSF